MAALLSLQEHESVLVRLDRIDPTLAARYEGARNYVSVPEGFSIEWVQSNAQQLVFEDDSFDFVFCQQGLQFVPDRAAAISVRLF